MFKSIKQFILTFSLYGFGNLMVKVVGLMLMPIYLRGLDTDGYGALIMFEVLTQFMVGVFSFRLESSLLRFGSETTDVRAQKRIYFTATMCMLAAAALVFVAFLPTGGLMSRFLFDTDSYRHYFPLLYGSIALEMLGLMPMQLFRLKEKPVSYIGFLAFKLLSLLGLVSYFVLVKDMGVYGALLGIFCANALVLLATIPAQIRSAVAEFDRKVAVEMFRFGTPLIFTSISALLLSLGDRIVIRIFGELSDVGVYGAAYKIGSVVNLLVINSFSLGFLPIAFKKFNEPDFGRFFSKMLTYFMLITVVFTLGISLFSKELIKMLSPESPDFWIAVILVPFIAFSFIFKAIQYYLSLTFHLTKRTRYDALVTMAGFAFNLGLNVVLVYFYGTYGAVAATGLSYIGMSLLTRHYANRLYPVKFERRNIAVLIISCAVFIAAGMALNDLHIIIRLVGKTALLGGYGLFLYFAVATQTEKDKVGKLYAALRQSGGLKKLISENKF